MGALVHVGIGLLFGVLARLLLPGFKGTSRAAAFALLAVSVLGAALGAVLGSALSREAEFLSLHTTVVTGSLLGSVASIAALGSPRGRRLSSPRA